MNIVMMVWLFAVSGMDIRFRQVSARLLMVGGMLAAAFVLCRNGSNLAGYYEVFIGMMPGGVLLAAAFATKKAGSGDGVALMILGMISGSKILPVFGFSLFLTAVFSIVLLGLRRVRRDTRIPYLPFLTAAWLLSLGTNTFLAL